MMSRHVRRRHRRGIGLGLHLQFAAPVRQDRLASLTHQMITADR